MNGKKGSLVLIMAPYLKREQQRNKNFVTLERFLIFLHSVLSEPLEKAN